MDGFDTALRGVTVEQFRAALLDAAEHVDVVQPPALREPISLWLRGLEERTRREGWRDLLGRHVVDAWNAARAILATRERAPLGEGLRPSGVSVPTAEVAD